MVPVITSAIPVYPLIVNICTPPDSHRDITPMLAGCHTLTQRLRTHGDEMPVKSHGSILDRDGIPQTVHSKIRPHSKDPTSITMTITITVTSHQQGKEIWIMLEDVSFAECPIAKPTPVSTRRRSDCQTYTRL